MSYVTILHVFLLRRTICSLFLWLGKIDSISHYCPQSSQILCYVNIFNINRKLLIQAFLIIDKCTTELHVGMNFTYMSYYFSK